MTLAAVLSFLLLAAAAVSSEAEPTLFEVTEKDFSHRLCGNKAGLACSKISLNEDAITDKDVEAAKLPSREVIKRKRYEEDSE